MITRTVIFTNEQTSISSTDQQFTYSSLTDCSQIPLYHEPLEAWVETLDGKDPYTTKRGAVSLHPEVFGAFPRIDILHWNLYWQKMYKVVDWSFAMTKQEKRGGGRKPWPQKGTGRARHGSIRSPLWHNGGRALGPRGPRTYYFMLPFMLRVRGLISALTCKFAQNDIHIVDSLESLPSDDTKFLEELCDSRGWGPSVLFVHESDFAPRNITVATDMIGHMNIMPVQGLNVYSMLKHETLVLSLKSAQLIQERLLFHLSRPDDWRANGKKVRPIINRPAPPKPLEFLAPSVTL
ncbi:39S ribosomal protein L4, mitochondrial-like isoform X2 [Varroa jacobsoni]|uniref:Large ribosomal subunit protein uL4m n=1 Tax=Varroa destructor TaxID=109461 RepID=A0A7M7KXZ6_VARDE|nr:39S ribosomal protein L4, mitochondrial-like isoform X2 [Varroa destructor]XP_022671213.1 39S ribosomal protein L4, mitochondrial-like isoform X2 [Varroa destructor]XP_022709054.1 39S ribosomal protein L4, mitochondrial-like isoform X2 [Varroa jacobsoni]XP_022709055.1 39S ribosomal protein L4, mitochondrial-like isoform X2 [Varroa jacobsoni]